MSLVSVSQTQETPRQTTQSIDTPKYIVKPQPTVIPIVTPRRDRTIAVCFFLWQGGTRSGPVLRNEQDIPIYVARMVGGEGGRQIRCDTPRGAGERRRAENGNWSGVGGQLPGSVIELDPRTLVVVRRNSLPPGIWPWRCRCYNLHHS